jgi:hypothetical protein
MFQGFACRQLDLDESWLAVDYQVRRPQHRRIM